MFRIAVCSLVATFGCSEGAGEQAALKTAGVSESTATPVTFGDAPVRFIHRAPEAGERLLWSTSVEIDLDAVVGVGILSKSIEYLLSEEEQVAVDVLAADGGGVITRLDYLSRRATSRAPLVGEKTKERRVHGKVYRVAVTDEGLAVTDDGGGKVRKKELPYVTRTWRTVSGRPALFDVLPANEDVEPGASFQVETEAAKRLLGLPLDELDVDTLALILRGTEDGIAVFDASANLSGEAELGGADTTLSANLSGTLSVSLDGCRLLAVDMNGTTTVSRNGDGMLSASGSGPLTLTRSVKER